MAKNKKIKIPTFLEIFQSQRVQIVTPKGGSHKDETKYNRKDKHKKDWKNHD
jgi:hypothetical protein